MSKIEKYFSVEEYILQPLSGCVKIIDFQNWLKNDTPQAKFQSTVGLFYCNEYFWNLLILQ